MLGLVDLIFLRFEAIEQETADSIVKSYLLETSNMQQYPKGNLYFILLILIMINFTKYY